MKRIQVLFWVVVFVLLSSLVNAAWVSGFIHPAHTYPYSTDGLRTSTQAKAKAKSAGGKFFISSDHFEQIKEDQKAQYLADFSGYYKGMLLVPGVEFKVVRPDGGESHLLAFFGTENFIWQTFPSDLQGLICQLNCAGAVTTSAHPNWKDALVNFTFDDSVFGYWGTEFFNGDFYFEDLNRYKQKNHNHEYLFSYAGVDSHTSLDPTDAARWLHKTYAFVKENGQLTATSLESAIRNGRTCATDNYAYPKKFNYIPGFTPQTVLRPAFNFQVGFSKKTKEAKSVKIYRNGVLVWNSIQTFSKGKSSITYQWRDNQTQPGIRTYVFEVEGCLITSPIVLNVTALPPAYAPFYITDDPVYDNFFALDVGASNGVDFESGKIKFGWTDEDVWPVEYPTSVFFSPAKIEIYEFLHHVVDSDLFMVGDFQIFDSSGAKIADAVGWIYDVKPYKLVWIKYQIEIVTPGRYLIRLNNFDNTVVIAEKTIWVY